MQTIPRNVVYDNKTGTNILQWPVEEIEDLRSSCRDYQEVVLEPGSIMPLDIESATQVHFLYNPHQIIIFIKLKYIYI